MKYYDYFKQDVSNFNFPRYLDRQKSTFEFKHDEPKLQKFWQICFLTNGGDTIV